MLLYIEPRAQSLKKIYKNIFEILHSEINWALPMRERRESIVFKLILSVRFSPLPTSVWYLVYLKLMLTVGNKMVILHSMLSYQVVVSIKTLFND